jgi:hypothetical protein
MGLDMPIIIINMNYVYISPLKMDWYFVKGIEGCGRVLRGWERA